MSNEQARINMLESKLREVIIAASQGLRSQLFRGDRSLSTNYGTSLKMSYKIEKICREALE